MFSFYTPQRHQKNLRFSDVSRRYKKGTPGSNGLREFKLNNFYSIGEKKKKTELVLVG